MLALHLDRSRDGVSRAREGEEERVTWESISVPFAAASVSRTSRRCSLRTSPYRSPSCLSSSVESSMSVKTNVTVPAGRVDMSGIVRPLERLSAQDVAPNRHPTGTVSSPAPG